MTEADLPRNEMTQPQLLRYHPDQFEALAWVRLTPGSGFPGYQPIWDELDAPPKDNKPSRDPVDTRAQAIVVRRRSRGRTGRRAPVDVFASENAAVQQYGRAVRTALEHGGSYEGLSVRRLKSEV